jgi:GNAT superfamily N-acetyltransferase
MRCDLARALIADHLVVFDEFTSVVDRIVAQVGSAALAKAIRKQSGRQFIAVTCHVDVAEWLEPDWIYEPATNTLKRRRLRRPSIDLACVRCHPSAWAAFRHAHYLSHDLNPAAVCYAATWRDHPVAFAAVLGMIGYKGCYRVSRIVVLPDYQGIGIGSRFLDTLGAHYTQQGKRLRITTSHPGFLVHLNHKDTWALCSQSLTGNARHGGRNFTSAVSIGRGVATFEYRGLLPSARPTP